MSVKTAKRAGQNAASLALASCASAAALTLVVIVLYLRHGNELVLPQNPMDTLDFNPVTGRLVWEPNTPLSKVSDSTTPPTPWPTLSP